MGFPSFSPRTDNVDIVSATDINPVYTEVEMIATGVPLPAYTTIQSLTDDLVLVDASLTVQSFTLDAAHNIYLPATSTDNHPFYLWNRTPSSDGFAATILLSTSDSFTTVSADSAKLIFPDGSNGWVALGGSGVETIVAGTNITVDATDPANPIVSSSGGGADILQTQVFL